MRTKEALFEMENITLLLQDLYVNPEHSIKYNNGMTTLEIYMNDDFEVYAKNQKYFTKEISSLRYMRNTFKKHLVKCLGEIK